MFQQTKQSLIQALVKQNSNARARVEKQKHEVNMSLIRKIFLEDEGIVKRFYFESGKIDILEKGQGKLNNLKRQKMLADTLRVGVFR